MQMILEIGLSNAAMAAALAAVAAAIGLFSPRPALRHTLWLLVLLKLVTPPVLTVPVAFPSVLQAVGASLASEDGKARQTTSLPQGSMASEDVALLDFEPFASVTDDLPRVAADARLDARQLATAAGSLTIASLVPFLFAVWFAGTVLWFAVAGIRIYRFQRLLQYGKAAPTALQDETTLLAERLGLVHCPTVWLVPGRVSPLLWALGRKVCLVVPVDLLSGLRPEQRTSLLAHELAHARRRDHWVRWLEFAVTGLYWWLPVTWWAHRQLQQAEEECCDAWVVWTLPSAAKAYAKALLQTVDFLDARSALPPVASGIGHVHLLKRRLTMIVRQPSCPCLPWPVHLATVLLGLLFLPLAPQRLSAQASEEKPAPALSEDAALVRAEQDSENRDTERRLRTLEEKLDRLMRKLDSQGGEKPRGKPSEDDRAAAAQERAKLAQERARERAKAVEEKVQAREKERAERAKEKGEKGRTKESTWRFDFDGKNMSPEQIDKLKKEIQDKVSKAVDPERMRQIQKKIAEAMDKNITPERMEEIQRKINDAMKKSNQELNEALKKGAEQLDRAKNSLQQANKASGKEGRFGTPRDSEERNLERRMDRLEQKMDRVLQVLEKQGKPAKF